MQISSRIWQNSEKKNVGKILFVKPWRTGLSHMMSIYFDRGYKHMYNSQNNSTKSSSEEHIVLKTTQEWKNSVTVTLGTNSPYHVKRRFKDGSWRDDA